jgi:prolyl oligopeptidase
MTPSRLFAPITACLLVSGCSGDAAPPPVTMPPTKAAPWLVPPPPPVVTKPSPFDYPGTRAEPVTDDLHGTKIVDPYRWLEDGKSDAVKTWLGGQDAFARAWLGKLPERDAIAARLRELFYVEGHGTPQHFGSRWFFAKREAKSEKWVVHVRDGALANVPSVANAAPKTAAATDRVLLDPNAWSKDGSVALGRWSPSHDGKKVAYAVKPNNSDEATLEVLDVDTGKTSDVDRIEGAKYASPDWTPDSKGFFYTWVPKEGTVPTADRPGWAEVRYHKLGTGPKTDLLVAPRTGDPKTFLSADVSWDGRWLFVEVQHGWTSNDVWVRDLQKRPLGAEVNALTNESWRPGDGFTQLVSSRTNKYAVVAHAGRFYVRTDEGAPRGRVFVVDPSKPARADWKEIVPEHARATLEGVSVIGGKLALGWLEDVRSRLEIRELDGKLVREVPLPAPGTSSGFSGRPDEDLAFFGFTSLVHPSEIHAVSVRKGEETTFFRVKLPFDPSPYAVEQQFATSKDGTKVPYFVVRRKDVPLDGKAPALVYGYGGFLGTQKPYFTSSVVPWLERGGAYVLTNLRGGAEYGEGWHEGGMRQKKQNVFDDLYAILAKISDDKLTSPSRIAVRGGSNGGLLVGAAWTQRPDLFRVGLCGVPLLDMVRYHLFGSGKTWIEEYGSADDAKDFPSLVAYSPYHHVETGKAYPSLLLLSADNDDRVAPLHAWKFAALAQARSGGGPVLLRVERNSGHGGADLVRATVEKTADELAFALAEIAKGPAAR